MKKAIYLCLSFVFLLILINFVSAITGSIGNARMILRVETGDTVEKSILVKNINNIPIDIELTASGDLADDVEIIDKNFPLDAGEEKKAYFKIKIKEPGTTETNINVKFTPEEGNGVGLSSTVIIIAKGEGEWEEDGSDDEEDDEEDDSDDEEDDEEDDSDDEEDDEEDDSDDEDEEKENLEDNNIITGNVISDSKTKKSINFALITTGITLVIFIALLILFKKTKQGIEVVEERSEADKKVKNKTKSKKKVQKK